MLPKMGVGVGVGAGINAGLIILLSVLAGVNSYSKFGRGCSDIGCMPNEECIISTASCSYNQRDGESCGNYPTCKRKSDAGAESTPGHVNPSAPSFQQFPQPNHPGSVLSPSFPGGLQPVNPYNPPFVFGQQPYYTAPGGTGGPPGGINGILGGSGGGLAPHSYYNGYQNPTYQNPNMYNKPPPQYQNQNQNPYNRQTQTYPSAAVSLISSLMTVGCAVVSLFLLNFP